MTILHYAEPGSGGVKRHLVDLLSTLDTRKHRYIFAYSKSRSDQTFLDELRLLQERGVFTCEIPTAAQIEPVKDFISCFNLLKILIKFEPEVLHLHSSKSGGIGRMVSALGVVRAHVIYVPHAMACFRSRIFGIIERVLAPLHDLLLAVSKSERADFISWGIESRMSRTSSIRLGIDLGYSRPDMVSKDDVGIMICSCGRICYQKNAVLFFELALLALKKHPTWHFRWIGDFGSDSESESVRNLLSGAGNPPQVEVTGWRNDSLPLIARSTVFCLFSRYESFGYVTAEAMSAGCAILATDATGTRDLVIDGVTGLIIPPNVTDALKALEHLVDRCDVRRSLGARAIQFVAESHSLERMARDVEEIYASIQNQTELEVV